MFTQYGLFFLAEEVFLLNFKILRKNYFFIHHDWDKKILMLLMYSVNKAIVCKPSLMLFFSYFYHSI